MIQPIYMLAEDHRRDQKYLPYLISLPQKQSLTRAKTAVQTACRIWAWDFQPNKQLQLNLFGFWNHKSLFIYFAKTQILIQNIERHIWVWANISVLLWTVIQLRNSVPTGRLAMTDDSAMRVLMFLH